MRRTTKSIVDPFASGYYSSQFEPWKLSSPRLSPLRPSQWSRANSNQAHLPSRTSEPKILHGFATTTRTDVCRPSPMTAPTSSRCELSVFLSPQFRYSNVILAPCHFFQWIVVKLDNGNYTMKSLENRQSAYISPPPEQGKQVVAQSRYAIMEWRIFGTGETDVYW